MKKLIVISILLSAILLVCCLWLYKDKLSNMFQKNHDAISPLQTKADKIINDTFVRKTFTDKSMHLTFQYPPSFTVYQVNPQTIFIANQKTADVNNGLLVYATNLKNGAADLKIPFSLPGKLQKSLPVTKKDFIAREDIYSDGKNETDLLILQRGQQFFITRIPQNSTPFVQALTVYINSVSTTN